MSNNKVIDINVNDDDNDNDNDNDIDDEMNSELQEQQLCIILYETIKNNLIDIGLNRYWILIVNHQVITINKHKKTLSYQLVISIWCKLVMRTHLFIFVNVSNICYIMYIFIYLPIHLCVIILVRQ